MSEHLSIAILEDCANERTQLVEALLESLKGSPIPPQIAEFASGEEFLAGYDPQRYDILFLDIFMGELSGMQVARKVRTAEPDLPIVFTTCSPELALEGYQVQAMHYLIKPVLQDELSEVWRRFIKQREGRRFVTLMVDRRPVDILLSDIYYVEAENKSSALHTRDGVVHAWISISQLESMLPYPPFCRCHRSYIVNFEHVRSVSNDFVMQNGDTVYIRQNEQERFREMYFSSLVDRAKRGISDVL